ncbi:MAG TPA: hypothetical protein VFL61_12245 [Gaiellaceae bacterium]|nr:hypothetical protein [Gaiellaceae bacterium]
MAALATGDAERLLRFAEAESLNGEEPCTPELVQADWVGFSNLDWGQRRLAFAVERPGNELEVDAGMERLFWGEFADTHPIPQPALRRYVGALKISDSPEGASSDGRASTTSGCG